MEWVGTVTEWVCNDNGKRKDNNVTGTKEVYREFGPWSGPWVLWEQFESTVMAAGQHQRKDQGGYMTPNGFKSKLLVNAGDY